MEFRQNQVSHMEGQTRKKMIPSFIVHVYDGTGTRYSRVQVQSRLIIFWSLLDGVSKREILSTHAITNKALRDAYFVVVDSNKFSCRDITFTGMLIISEKRKQKN